MSHLNSPNRCSKANDVQSLSKARARSAKKARLFRKLQEILPVQDIGTGHDNDENCSFLTNEKDGLPTCKMIDNLVSKTQQLLQITDIETGKNASECKAAGPCTREPFCTVDESAEIVPFTYLDRPYGPDQTLPLALSSNEWSNEIARSILDIKYTEKYDKGNCHQRQMTLAKKKARSKTAQVSNLKTEMIWLIEKQEIELQPIVEMFKSKLA